MRSKQGKLIICAGLLAVLAVGIGLTNVASRRAHEARALGIVRQIRIGDSAAAVLSLAASKRVNAEWQAEEGRDVKRLVLVPADNKALFLAQTEFVLTFVFDRVETCTQTRVLAANDEDRFLTLRQPD